MFLNSRLKSLSLGIIDELNMSNSLSISFMKSIAYLVERGKIPTTKIMNIPATNTCTKNLGYQIHPLSFGFK